MLYFTMVSFIIKFKREVNYIFFFSLGNLVDVSQFIQSKSLSYLLISLSSKCDKLRALAYGSLYRFNLHLESEFNKSA